MSQDLNGVYIKHMRHHGCGVAMFQPVAFADMKPPCCGYFDQNGKWNLIARLSMNLQETALSHGLEPLKREPAPMRQIGLRWQPKCSKGVRMFNVDITGKSPNVGVPVGADAHIKYKSKTQFGAVLIAKNPVSVTAVNDECLFKDWVESNKARLYGRFGRELKRYGMWVVTVTFSAPGCSINAWQHKDKEALISAKAKASMVGDYGAELDWTDKIMDKDWSHYSDDPTKWNEQQTTQATNSPFAMAQNQVTPDRTEQHDPSGPNDRSITSDVKSPTTSTNDTKSKIARSADDRPARSISRKAALSRIGDHANGDSVQQSASTGRTSQTLGPGAPKRESASLDRSNGGHRSRSHTHDPSMKASQSVPAKNDGVVLFFDGLRVDQMEWWAEGFKKITCSIFNSSSTRADNDISSRQRPRMTKYLSVQSPNSRLPIWATNEAQHEYSPLHSSFGQEPEDHGDCDEDYDPEKDEGVYPSEWPRKSLSILSGHGTHQDSADDRTVYSDEARARHVRVSELQANQEALGSHTPSNYEKAAYLG